MKQTLLIKYSEIGVKGKNRYVFEDMLVKNMKSALKVQKQAEAGVFAFDPDALQAYLHEYAAAGCPAVSRAPRAR